MPFDILALVLIAMVLLYFFSATLRALLTSCSEIARAAKAGIYLVTAVPIVLTIGSQNHGRFLEHTMNPSSRS